jgi:hypothetical protein
MSTCQNFEVRYRCRCRLQECKLLAATPTLTFEGIYIKLIITFFLHWKKLGNPADTGSLHLAHSQSIGTAAPARDQKLRRPQISGLNAQNNNSFRYKDAVTSFFRSGQVRCSRRFNFNI